MKRFSLFLLPLLIAACGSDRPYHPRFNPGENTGGDISNTENPDEQNSPVSDETTPTGTETPDEQKNDNSGNFEQPDDEQKTPVNDENEPESINDTENLQNDDSGESEQPEELPEEEPMPDDDPGEEPEPSKWVLIPAGGFFISSNSDTKINLAAFKIMRYEVTVNDIADFINSDPKRENEITRHDPTGERYMDRCNFGASGRGAHPMNCLKQATAEDYCESIGARLPSSHEWLKAARGDKDGRRYPWGDENPDCEKAVVGPNGCGKWSTWPIGSRPLDKSPYGVLDMAGNISEYSQADYDGKIDCSGDDWLVNSKMGLDRAGDSVYQKRDDYTLGFRCAKDVE